jgi:hypothetical protein
LAQLVTLTTEAKIEVRQFKKGKQIGTNSPSIAHIYEQ